MSDNPTRPDHDHERSDVAPRWPIYIGVGMLLTLPLAVAVVAALLYSVWAPPPQRPGPAIETPAPAVNAPRLQLNPRADLAALRDRWDHQLHSTGWVDRDAGIVHVPIDQAERRLLAHGLPDDTRMPGPSRAGEAMSGTASDRAQAGQGADADRGSGDGGGQP
ncbi:hypothetical protein [Salinisphaera aquimarina]|uniref:Uncharacterized protein n=1 Tax=Salinisphaera aquimarina TaxID=2094031 RepID=A0ABV7EM64_9GAMM